MRSLIRNTNCVRNQTNQVVLVNNFRRKNSRFYYSKNLFEQFVTYCYNCWFFVFFFGPPCGRYNYVAAKIKMTSMGLFNFFRKKNYHKDKNEQSIFKLQGPRYLRKNLAPLTTDIVGKFKIRHPGVQWLGQLVSKTQNRLFRIMYYGHLLDNEIIVSTTENIPQRIVAIDSETFEEILLFDKALYGWDGFIADSYGEQKQMNREPNNFYQTKNGLKTFRIIFEAYYNDSTRHELLDMLNSEGQVELANRDTICIQDAFDDAFDSVVIYGIDESGKKYQLVNEELA